MAKLLTRVSKASAIGRAIAAGCGLALSMLLTGCGGTPVSQEVANADHALRTGEAELLPFEPEESEPASGEARPDDKAGEAAPPSDAVGTGPEAGVADAATARSTVDGASPDGPGAGVNGSAMPPGSPPGSETLPQQVAPAAAAPATAAVPAPAVPAIDDDPERLMGIGTLALTKMLGDPRFVRRDASTQLWRYRNDTCILDLFLYPTDGGAEYAVSHIETRRREGGATSMRECFGALLLERMHGGAG